MVDFTVTVMPDVSFEEEVCHGAHSPLISYRQTRFTLRDRTLRLLKGYSSCGRTSLSSRSYDEKPSQPKCFTTARADMTPSSWNPYLRCAPQK